MPFDEYLKNAAVNFDIHLAATVHEFASHPLFDCVEYALFSGGKRLRPLLYTETLKLFGKTPSSADYDLAAAIECLHTYTLIHDDLPCMDNDDFRRGNPSVHKKYGEAEALLAGDVLQALAFKLCSRVAAQNNVYRQAAALMGDAAVDVVKGQALEIRFPENIKDNIFEIYLNKTSRLLTLPVIMAAKVIGADPYRYAAAERFGLNFGIAFQLSDDMLDKDKDEDNFVRLFGKTAALQKIKQYCDVAKHEAAEFCGKEEGFLSDLTDFIVERTY